MSRRLLLIAACGATLAGCGTGPVEQRVQLYALHTLVEVVVVEPDPARARVQLAAAEGALRAAELRLAAWGDGELARANAALAGGGRAMVGVELASALLDARDIAARSGWAFDPGVGRMVELWGFQRDDPPPSTPPDPAALAALVAAGPSISHLAIDGTTLASPDRLLWLDLGAYGKGAAVDAALAALRDAGARGALVAAAGDICAIGTHGDRPWRIGVRDPDGGMLGALALVDGECVSTSGDYERGFVHDGVRYHHVLDPRRGVPTRGLRSVTVIARRGALADAAATAGMVAGAPDAEALRALGIEAALALRDDGSVALTPAMHARLVAEGSRRALVVTP
jgi:thiamine biosynthesis lipoprotein